MNPVADALLFRPPVVAFDGDDTLWKDGTTSRSGSAVSSIWPPTGFPFQA